MNKNIPRRSLRTMACFVDEVPPEGLPEAEEELRELGLDASAVGNRLERDALNAIRTRILREHS
jgi:hypothetical protein